MNETTFENARVGDRVCDVVYGWGTVSRIDEGAIFPVRVEFRKNHRKFTITYFFSGQQTHGRPQTLFWDEIPIIAPPRPKRLVTKTAVGWMNVYPSNVFEFWDTQATADEYASKRRIACVKLTGSYEVEE
jgi:hypothetical protein